MLRVSYIIPALERSLFAYDFFRILEVLVNHGADVNLKNDSGKDRWVSHSLTH